MRRTLIVTNDFPPRQGGIQSFVHELALRLDPEDLTVYAPKWDGAPEFDARQPFEVVRHPTSLMIGGPSVTRRAAELARSRKAEVVIFGAAAPLGLITPALRRAGVWKAIAITHGHEAGWAALPVARSLLRRIGERTDVVTYLGEYFRVRLARALTPDAAARLTQLHPGVDAAALPPDPAAPPAHSAAGDVFSMPCRPRRGGLDVEVLGIVYLEASAAGLPVVGGDSGGAPDAILEGETGYVVGGRDVPALSDRLVALLSNPEAARAMGEKGRAWVERDWSWDQTATPLRAIIESTQPPRRPPAPPPPAA